MNKKILFLTLLGVLVLPTISLAADCPGGITLGNMACVITGQVVLVATFIVVIMWVVTGILFLTAQGDPGKLNSAKTALFASIGGTILIILANSAILFVGNSFGLTE